VNRFNAIAEAASTEALNIPHRNIVKYLGKLNPHDSLERIPICDKRHASLSRPIVKKCVPRVGYNETGQYPPDQFGMRKMVENPTGDSILAEGRIFRLLFLIMRAINVAGAHPNFVKIASPVKRMQGQPESEQILVHTGQHYDEVMSQQFFEDLEIPRPEINLHVGSGTQAEQTAEILKRRFEPIVMDSRPDVVLVVGDVNSTIACHMPPRKLA
jgi:hypothetical protein